MATHQKPNISEWYISADGQFVRIWGLAYKKGQLDRVVIQQLSGKRYHVNLNGWYRLDLVHYPMPDMQASVIKNSSTPHS